jgi:4-amino-4-deoxy-L-arabinose transferase-like glycosyltransferase
MVPSHLFTEQLRAFPSYVLWYTLFGLMITQDQKRTLSAHRERESRLWVFQAWLLISIFKFARTASPFDPDAISMLPYTIQVGDVLDKIALWNGSLAGQRITNRTIFSVACLSSAQRCEAI